MFCEKCGTKNEAGVEFCGGCGAPVNQSAPAAPVEQAPAPQPVPQAAPQPQPVQPGAGEFVAGGIKFSAANEDSATFALGGTVLQAGLIFKVLAVALLVMMFLPFFSVGVSMGGFMGLTPDLTMTETVNGLDIAFSEGGTALAIFLFLIPIALFALYQFKASLQFATGKLFMFSTGLCVLGILMLFLVWTSIPTFGGMIEIGVSAGWIISLILYVVAGAASFGLMTAAKKK